MIIKLCYGPGKTYTGSNIGAIDYTNNSKSNVVFDTVTKQLFELGDNTLNEVTDEYNIYVSLSAIHDLESLAGDTSKYFVNICTVLNNITGEWERYAFSGMGYLCDDCGKTVDVLK